MAGFFKGIVSPGQCYWGAAIVYPVWDLIRNTNRDEQNFFAKFYTQRSPFRWSENNINLLDDELLKFSKVKDENLSGCKINFSTHPGVHDKVFGLFSATSGVEFNFATRILVENAEEFRSILPETVKELTKNKFTSYQFNLIPDTEINSLILSETAKRFIFLRSIIRANSYIYMIGGSICNVMCYILCYPVFVFLGTIVGPVTSMVIVPFLAMATFYFLLKPMYNRILDGHLDHEVLSIDKTLLKGAYEYLEKSQKFCLLMNRLAKKDRGHPFSTDGNRTDTSTPFSYRLQILKDYQKTQEKESRKLKKYV